jgi:hypothetical protein
MISLLPNDPEVTMGTNFGGPSLRMRLYNTGVDGPCVKFLSSNRVAPLLISMWREGWVGVSGEIGISGW